MVPSADTDQGGDPHVVADKFGRIFAWDTRGQVRQFSHQEPPNINASLFYNYDGGGYRGNPGNRGGGYFDLQILRAYSGLNNRINDVNQLRRDQVQIGTLTGQQHGRAASKVTGTRR